MYWGVYNSGEFGIAWAQEVEDKHARQRNKRVASHTSCTRNLHLWVLNIFFNRDALKSFVEKYSPWVYYIDISIQIH